MYYKFSVFLYRVLRLTERAARVKQTIISWVCINKLINIWLHDFCIENLHNYPKIPKITF